MPFKVGDKADGYEFLRLLGSSGAAVVYEVLNERRGRREMLKVLPRQLIEDQEGVDRFHREVEIRAQLSHPNIAEFYGAVMLDGQPAMATEMVEGVTLEERLAEGPVTMGEAIDIALRTLDALDYAHRRQVVHREVAPSNICLLPDQGVKLSGFGLAKQYADPKLTAAGMVVGQVHYLSPEQVKGAAQIDGRSDLYSLGIVLFETLTGQKPFDSKSQFDIIQAHVLEAPPFPSDLREDLPKALEKVLLRALEKFAGDRYLDARELSLALEAVRGAVRAVENKETAYQVRDPIDDLEEEEGSARPVELPPALREAIERRRRPIAADAPPQESAPAAPQESVPTMPPLTTAVGGAAAAALSAAPTADRGWRPQDLAVIGLLTFVMVAATVLTVLIVFGD